jgi:uncharacterized protein DUF885
MADIPAVLQRLAEEFWAWRAAAAPDSPDDLPRLERPPGWAPDWSAAAVAVRRERAAEFSRRCQALDVANQPVAVQVDARLLRCALDRVRWELDLLRGWQRNPCFYVDQSLVPLYNLLLVSAPFTESRASAAVRLLRGVPAVLTQARQNLAGEAAAPFAASALRKLAEVDTQLSAAMAALAPLLPPILAGELPRATEEAVAALRGYRDWLRAELPTFRAATSAGPQTLAFLLYRVALVPYTVDQLREQSRLEWARSVALEAILRNRHAGHHHAAEPAADMPALLTRERVAEEQIRRFYSHRGVLSQPPALRHYRFAARPPYLEPLAWLGVCDDLTSASRVDEDAVRYVASPAVDLPYFDRAAATDPRTAIAHEGVHAQQFALSWRHPNPARRRFYDSVPNEGIAFYNEELMLASGVFDDSPPGAEFIANAMRLRALRVGVDIALALGELTLDQAAERLCRLVPMDEETAWEEAVFFSGNPGQGLSYQTGKLQIQDLLAAAAPEDGFSLQAFHDRLWQEGNVPLSLQRWEHLADPTHLATADQLAAGLP